MQLSASVLVVLMLLPSAARGQTAAAALPRADVAAATGWFVADRSVNQGCCSSWSASLFKGVSGGYYWTEHLKTDVEFAAPGPTEGYTYFNEQLASNLFRYTSEEHTITASRVTLSQAYQFGHNSSFHPFVRGGVDIDRERDEIERRISIGNAFVEQHSQATAVRARPFAGAGFKAYFNERAFFKGEARFTPGRDEVRQMIWTAGVGIDLGGRRRPARAADSLASLSANQIARVPEPAARWHDYASKLQIGERIEVTTARGKHLIADLVAVDDDGITVKPVVRFPSRRSGFHSSSSSSSRCIRVRCRALESGRQSQAPARASASS